MSLTRESQFTARFFGVLASGFDPQPRIDWPVSFGGIFRVDYGHRAQAGIRLDDPA